jgi:hypothetical protein
MTFNQILVAAPIPRRRVDETTMISDLGAQGAYR